MGGYTASSGMSDFLVARYSMTTGFLDNTFGDAGRLETPLSTEQDVATAVLIQGDGKILVGGSAKATVFQFALTRFDAAGSLDLTFGTNGVTRTSIDADFNQLEAMAIQADGKILAAGYGGDFPGYIGVARYNNSSVPLAVNDPLLQFADIQVYPNPASDEVHISYALHEQLDVVLELRNALGQQVQRLESNNVKANDQQQETLELGELSSGIYYLSVGTSDAWQTFKIVKN